MLLYPYVTKVVHDDRFIHIWIGWLLILVWLEKEQAIVGQD